MFVNFDGSEREIKHDKDICISLPKRYTCESEYIKTIENWARKTRGELEIYGINTIRDVIRLNDVVMIESRVKNFKGKTKI